MFTVFCDMDPWGDVYGLLHRIMFINKYNKRAKDNKGKQLYWDSVIKLLKTQISVVVMYVILYYLITNTAVICCIHSLTEGNY